MARRRPSVPPGRVTGYDEAGTGAAPAVQAQGVDVFTPPGAAGMPQAPTAAPLPVETSNQDAMDLARLGKELEGLSASVGQFARAEAIGLPKLRAAGAEEAQILQDQMNKSGKTFADMVDEGLIPAFRHPAAQKGFATAMGENLTREYYNEWVANTEKRRAGNGNIYDHDKIMQEFDLGLELMQKELPGIARRDVLERSIITSQSAYREKVANTHQKWLSGEMLEKSEIAAKMKIENAITEGASLTIDPRVIYVETKKLDIWGQKIRVPSGYEVEDAATIWQRRVDATSDAVTAFLDSEYGGLLTNRINEIVAVKLTDLASGSNDLATSQLAHAVLKATKTGPKNNRSNLLGTESGKAYEYYSKAEPTIGTHQATLIKRERKIVFDQVTDNAIDAMSKVFENRVTNAPNTGPAELVAMMADMKVEDIELGGGFTIGMKGDTGTIRDVFGNSRDVNIRRVAQDMIAKADAKYVGDLTETLQTDGKPNPETRARAHAYRETGRSDPVMKEWLGSGLKAVTSASMSPQMPEEDRNAAVATFARGLGAFMQLRGMGVHGGESDHLTDHQNFFYGSAEIMLRDTMVAGELQTGSYKAVFDLLAPVMTADPQTIKEFKEAFDEDFAASASWAKSRYSLSPFIEMVKQRAKTLIYFDQMGKYSGTDGPEKAISDSIDYAEESMVELPGGITAHRDDVGIFSTGFLALNEDGKLPQLDVGESIINRGLATVEQLDAARDWFNKYILVGPVGKIREATAIGGDDPADMLRWMGSGFANLGEAMKRQRRAIGQALGETYDTPQYGLFTKEGRHQFLMESLGTYVASQENPGKRNITRDEALVAATERLQTNPPPEFAADNQLLGHDIVGFKPIVGQRGGLWNLVISYGGDQQIQHGVTFTLPEIVDLGQWDKKKKKPTPTMSETMLRRFRP